MLELKFIVEHPDIVKSNLQKRGDEEKQKWVDEIVNLYSMQKKLSAEVEALRARRNSISNKINEEKKAGRNPAELLREAASIPETLREKEKLMEEINQKILFYRMRIPNILHESVPVGKDSSENV